MNQILVVVHQGSSNPGLVGEKLRSQGYQLDVRCPALGDPLPSTMAQHTAAIILGGPMSANDDDTLPFIRTELDWIPTALASQKPYLGICLGAQLLARVLGAQVSPHPNEQREIGYFGLRPTPAGQPYIPQPMAVYHWHREGFAIPEGAIKLAEGDTFPNQAFCYAGNAFGFQFHPEITPELIDDWTSRVPEQLTLPGAQPRDLHFHNHEQFGATVDKWLDRFLEAWVKAAPWNHSQSA
ncbi:MAG: glutamine amidotransferase [Cyanobacteria bacterium P01_F01_bin.86]